MAATAIAAPEISNLRAQTVPLAAELARLGSAAQFFSGLGNQSGKPTAQLLAGFKEARTKLRDLQTALKSDDAELGQRLLEGLLADCERQKAFIASVDQAVTCAQLERYIASAKTVTADLLARLIDYYAEVAERTTTSRDKLVAVAVLLADREACGNLPGKISQAFRKRGVLRFGQRRSLDQARIKWAADLRRRILAVGQAPESEVAAVQTELAGYRDELGDDLHCLAGLCVAVTLELARRESEATLERSRVRGFDTVISDLSGLLEEDPELLKSVMGDDGDENADDALLDAETIAARGEEEARAAVEADDAGAQARLDEVAAAVTEAIANDALESYHLEPVESEAAAIAASERDESQAALFDAAIARITVDQLARKHARAGQPEGEEPEPVPRAIAVSLIRTALRLERGLDDICQRALINADMETAKTITRCLHRLSRARIGLALLAEVNPTGNQSTHEPAPARARENDEDKLKNKLQAAVLMRDALKEDKSPRPVVERRTGRLAQAKPPKVRKSMVAVLVMSALAAGGYHGYNLVFQQSEIDDPLSDFSAPMPLEEVEHNGGTFTATADPTWASWSKQERQQRLRELWATVEERGFARLILVDYQHRMPVGTANAIDVKVLDVTSPADGRPEGAIMPE